MIVIRRNIVRNREPIITICCSLFIERIRRYGFHSSFGGVCTQLTLTAAAGIVWLIAIVEIPSGYRTGRCWQTARTREQTELLFTTGQRSLTGPDNS